MKKFYAFALLLMPLLSKAQNDRLTDDNEIAWGQLFTTIRVSEKWDVLAEYQWRRANGLNHWQQSLARTGVQHRFNNQLSFAVGYAWIETFPYGDFPIAANGTFPEHRTHQQVQLKNTLGKLTLNQRLRIEQRWIGRRTATPHRDIEDWVFSHRFRHSLRLQHPVVNSKTFNLYAAAADEVFINAGKNVGVNVLDQNRLMLIVGTKLSNKVAIESGYINQTLIQGRRINNQTIVQNNNGATLAFILNL